ncbi:hypothetical protein DFP72DRAFT_911000 [Ephemerocybe angulata]|uniref:Uncharacterized protein n=1 Tax=Ephemerocybe angulata TaxID=980116 RepID=A0A8H6HRC4_9AGAR|nr:hypothetical protein DFP72DRAFT_911000 [Tulosesus angulatus]
MTTLENLECPCDGKIPRTWVALPGASELSSWGRYHTLLIELYRRYTRTRRTDNGSNSKCAFCIRLLSDEMVLVSRRSTLEGYVPSAPARYELTVALGEPIFKLCHLKFQLGDGLLGLVIDRGEGEELMVLGYALQGAARRRCCKLQFVLKVGIASGGHFQLRSQSSYLILICSCLHFAVHQTLCQLQYGHRVLGLLLIHRAREEEVPGEYY